MNYTITHLTSVHPRYDTRIFIKMCSSLAHHETFTVNLVVADGKGDEVHNNVHIFDVGKTKGGRLSRMTKSVQNVFEKAKVLDADVYHLHDPELIPIGLKLKKMGKKVIFDAHEDFPKQLLGKPYLTPLFRKVLSKIFTYFESFTCKKFDYIITATPYIRDKFLKINPHSIDINNFPILGELMHTTAWGEKKNEVCYIGGIAKVRGIEEIIEAMVLIDGVRLNLAGDFPTKTLREKMLTFKGWQKTNELGFLGRKEVMAVMAKSKAGLVTLHPLVNYKDALPVKMFEYMSAKLPVIASHFTVWKEIIEGNQCGICVDPQDSQEIAQAIQYILDNPKQAQVMGENGYRAVVEKYNWAIEEKKLLNVYEVLLIEMKN